MNLPSTSPTQQIQKANPKAPAAQLPPPQTLSPDPSRHPWPLNPSRPCLTSREAAASSSPQASAPSVSGGRRPFVAPGALQATTAPPDFGHATPSDGPGSTALRPCPTPAPPPIGAHGPRLQAAEPDAASAILEDVSFAEWTWS